MNLLALTFAPEDLNSARPFVDRLPPQLLQEDEFAFHVSRLWLRLIEPEKALQVLRRVPREFFEEGRQYLPKGYVAGWVLHMAGRQSAAEAEWRQALVVAEKRLASDPNRAELLRWRASLLALTGEKTKAREGWKLASEFGEEPGARGVLDAARFRIALGEHEDAIRLLATSDIMKETGRIGHDVKLDPEFAPVREDPRVKQLIASGEEQRRKLWRRLPEPPETAAGSPETTAPGSGLFGHKSVVRNQNAVAAQPPLDFADAKSTKSVAVLAFANLSDDKENEYFSDGISEELLNVLAKVPGLRVAARTSAFYFKGKNVPAQEIGQKLGVAHLVEGSVRRAGTKVRIVARLSKAETGEQVWSESYERELKDIFALQDEIAGLIAKNLRLKLGPPSRATRAVNPEAHRLVLEGRHYWNQRTLGALDQARGAFQRAVAIDTDFADAHAGIALEGVVRANLLQVDTGTDGAAEIGRARAAAAQAIKLDESAADAHAALGFAFLLERNFAAAELSLERALALNPNSAIAYHWLAQLDSARGRLESAIDRFAKASLLDPLFFTTVAVYSRHLLFAGRASAAQAAAEHAERARGEDGRQSIDSARIAYALGRRDETLAAARSSLEHTAIRPGRNAAYSNAIWVLAQLGLNSEASEHAAKLLEQWPADTYRRGFVLGALGRFKEAMPFLERTPVTQFQLLFWDSMWDPFREDPRFAQLMATLGCTEDYKTAREGLARMRDAETRR